MEEAIKIPAPVSTRSGGASSGNLKTKLDGTNVF